MSQCPDDLDSDVEDIDDDLLDTLTHVVESIRTLVKDLGAVIASLKSHDQEVLYRLEQCVGSNTLRTSS